MRIHEILSRELLEDCKHFTKEQLLKPHDLGSYGKFNHEDFQKMLAAERAKYTPEQKKKYGNKPPNPESNCNICQRAKEHLTGDCSDW
jgi:hypothetical protein